VKTLWPQADSAIHMQYKSEAVLIRK
jgi:hypothetical protein